MLQITNGISAIDAQPIASALSEMPGPALPVTARYPENEQPSAIETDASSSSACTKIPPYFGSSRRSVSMTDDHGVTGLKCHQRRVDDALVLAAEFLGNQPFQLVSVEIENFRDQTEDENIFAFVFGGAAERFDRQTCDRHADVNETFIVEVRLNVV